MASENGTLAKLVALRLAFLASVEEARSQFVGRIKEARESYIAQVVDVTLGDPELSEVERALSAWVTPNPLPRPSSAVTSPSSTAVSPQSTPGMVPIGQSGVPEKFPMKGHRFGNIYGTCPNCNAAVWEPQAKFCSQCAYPLNEL